MTSADTTAQTGAYPAKLKYVGAIAEEYVAKRGEGPTWAWEQEQVRTWTLSRPKGSSVLDVPFGTGRYVPLYQAAGLAIHGSDISADMIAAAERELGDAFAGCDVQVGDAETLDHLAAGSVDAALCGRLIQWLPDLAIVERVLAAFARVTRDELFLELQIPASRAVQKSTLAQRVRRVLRQSPAVTLDRLRRKLTRHPSTDWKTYLHREADVLALAAAHGWRLESIGPECPSSPGVRFYRLRKG